MHAEVGYDREKGIDTNKLMLNHTSRSQYYILLTAGEEEEEQENKCLYPRCPLQNKDENLEPFPRVCDERSVTAAHTILFGCGSVVGS